MLLTRESLSFYCYAQVLLVKSVLHLCLNMVVIIWSMLDIFHQEQTFSAWTLEALGNMYGETKVCAIRVASFQLQWLRFHICDGIMITTRWRSLLSGHELDTLSQRSFLLCCEHIWFSWGSLLACHATIQQHLSMVLKLLILYVIGPEKGEVLQVVSL